MSRSDTTELLIELSKGDVTVFDKLLPVIYDELRRIAANYLRRERRDHTLQPTALVNEAYLKMVDITQVSWQNRAHFVAVAANQMRRILVDHARSVSAEKRGGGLQILTLNEEIDKSDEQTTDLMLLDEALTELAQMDPIKAKIVELRYFGGLTTDETAEVLGVSTITIKRHWKMAKAWLYGQMTR